MDMQQLLDLCQWDFTSYSDALAISPYQRDVIHYTKLVGSQLRVRDPQEPFNSEIIQTENYLIRIGTEPFGFYSWMPNCRGDQSLVLEHKVKPKPYTKHKPEDEGQVFIVDSITSTIESLISQEGFLAGISCISEPSYGFDYHHYQVMFAKTEANPLPVFANFTIGIGQLFCMTEEERAEFFDLSAKQILAKRERLVKGGSVRD